MIGWCEFSDHESVGKGLPMRRIFDKWQVGAAVPRIKDGVAQPHGVRIVVRGWVYVSAVGPVLKIELLNSPLVAAS